MNVAQIKARLKNILDQQQLAFLGFREPGNGLTSVISNEENHTLNLVA